MRFPDVPETGTDAETLEDALTEAQNALLAAPGGYVEQRRDIPVPSPVGPGRHGVALLVLVSAKLAFYQAMRDQGVNNTQLAKRLGVSETVIRRMVDLDHNTRIDHLERALALLGKRLVTQVFGRGVNPRYRKICAPKTLNDYNSSRERERT